MTINLVSPDIVLSIEFITHSASGNRVSWLTEKKIVNVQYTQVHCRVAVKHIDAYFLLLFCILIPTMCIHCTHTSCVDTQLSCVGVRRSSKCSRTRLHQTVPYIVHIYTRYLERNHSMNHSADCIKRLPQVSPGSLVTVCLQSTFIWLDKGKSQGKITSIARKFILDEGELLDGQVVAVQMSRRKDSKAKKWAAQVDNMTEDNRPKEPRRKRKTKEGPPTQIK